MNFLPYSVYKQLDLGELKLNLVTLQLADISRRYPKGIIEDVLVQINNFYLSMYFTVIDIAPIKNWSSSNSSYPRTSIFSYY